VPGIVIGDGANRAGGPIHRAEGARPDREHQIAGGAEEGLVHDELVVAVFVEALQARTVAAHAMHARRGIARELDPAGLERMELRMDHRARERNHRGRRPVEAADNQPSLRRAAGLPREGRGQPAAIGTDRALAKLHARESKDAALFEGAAPDGPQFPSTRDHQRFAIGVQRGGVRMYGRAVRQLAALAAREREFKQLGIARAVAGEEDFPIARKE